MPWPAKPHLAHIQPGILFHPSRGWRHPDFIPGTGTGILPGSFKENPLVMGAIGFLIGFLPVNGMQRGNKKTLIKMEMRMTSRIPAEKSDSAIQMKKRERVASILFHLCMGMVMLAASSFSPQLFIIYLLGIVYYISLFLYSWLFGYVTPLKGKTAGTNPARLLLWVFLFGMIAVVLKIKTDSLEIVAGFLVMAYYFLHQALLAKIKQDSENAQAG